MPETHLSVEDYIEALREIGGEAGSAEIAEKTDRHTHTVNRALDPGRDDIDVPVERQKIGGSYVYRLVEKSESGDA